MKTCHQHVQRESEQVLMRGLIWWLLKRIMLRTHEHGWTTWGPVTTWHSLVQPPMLVLFVGFIPVPYYVDPHTPLTPFQYYPCTAPILWPAFLIEKNNEGDWIETMHTTFFCFSCMFNFSCTTFPSIQSSFTWRLEVYDHI